MKESSSSDPLISDRSGVTDAVRVQILAAEHWDLLATRSMTWNQIFSRASMFITMVSAVTVALALVAQATSFDSHFRLFALLLLPVVLLLGFATFTHLGEANGEDVKLQMSMHQIHRAYLDLAPELQPFLPKLPLDVTVGTTQLSRPGLASTLIHFLGATPVVIASINTVVVGVILALITDALGASDLANVLVGITASILGAFGHALVIFYRVSDMRNKMRQN